MKQISQKREASKAPFSPVEAAFQWTRARFWRLLRRLALTKGADETIKDQMKDHVFPFDEYPPCEMCSDNSVTERLITRDGSRIVECDSCGLWFTSPRIKEQLWIGYLKSITDRNVEFTENRLKYGKAMSANVKYVLPNWRKFKTKIHYELLNEIEIYLGRGIDHLHDVGCGVGFLIEDAESRGIEATGNDLNKYACKIMSDRHGLTVYNDILPNLDIEAGRLDVIVFRDYIEHTYHPLADLKAAYRFLKPKGILYIHTFHIDCIEFESRGGNWNMLFWNHVFHFSKKTLENIVIGAGFNILNVKTSDEDIMIEIFARKE